MRQIYMLCTLSNMMPPWIRSSSPDRSLTPCTLHAHLRSSVTLEPSLSIPRPKTRTIGPRGLYLAPSTACNALPVHLRDHKLSLNTELSTGRMDPRVGSGRVGSGHDFAGFWRVGSGQHFGFLSCYWLFLGT